MFSSVGGLRRRCASLAGILLTITLVGGALSIAPGAVTPAGADTAPVDPTLPTTVSAAALPTAQMNGVAWAQVIVGNRVYVTGQFTQARPAGSALGVNETPRTNLLAYDITTGDLIQSWAPTLNAQGLAIAASADGSTIYVGGDFDQVSGVSRSRIVALDAQTGAVRPFNPGANTTVRAITVNGATNTVYYGGYFTATGNAGAGFTPRNHLAAVDGTTGDLLPWAPATDREVVAMIVHPASGRVIVGGSFNTLNGVQARGSGSVDGVTGANTPWAANQTIQNYGDGVEVGAFTTDGTQIFGSGWTFLAGGGVGNLEGVFAADAMTGNINWINATRGDNYSVAYADNVVYSVGHTHDAGMLGWNPQTPDPWQFQRTNAISSHVSPTLTNAIGTNGLWNYFPGFKAAQPLHWLPTLTGGTFTGQGQAAWSVATNGDYVVEAGEFPKVNNIAQQGLVRFAKREIAGSNVDDIQNYTELTPTVTDAGGGTVRIAWKAAWDRDNARIKVEVLRGATTATSTVLKTFETKGTTWWNRPPLSFYDSTAPAGSSQTYRIRVTDPFGNGYAGPPVTYTIPAGTPTASTYTDTVLADNPSWEWRLGETSGTAARDRAGSNDLVLGSGVSRNQSGALLNETDKAVNFPGSSSTSTVQGAAPFWQLGPQVFSLEAWVNTNTNQGGKIIGFGDSRTGRSDGNNVDRHLYMTNGGQIRFGVRPDMGTRQSIGSPSNYRDSQWHHVVGTLDGSGMKLYVDGNLVASNAAVIKAQVYQGYWRVGGDNLSSWTSQPSREAINAKIDEVAVYPTALSLGRIRAHYLASGRNTVFPNINPVASFTSSHVDYTATLASTSTDDDGTITNTAWNFGDSTTGSGASTQHTYAAAGTYNVTVTVTDNNGGTSTSTAPVTVTDPPPNVLPTAAFSSSVLYHSASLTSSSTDSDGTIVSSAWDFGDSSTGSGLSPAHDYAAAGTYNVSLTVTDNRGGTNTIIQPVVITDQYATDSFGRTVANGLGSADRGGAYTLTGTASDFSVSNGAGQIVGALNANRAGYLAAVHQTDIDTKVDFSLNTAATGGGAYATVIGRRVSVGNDYRLKVRYLAGGSVAAYLVRTLGGTETTISTLTIPGLTVSPGDGLRARFQVSGSSPTTLRARVWRQNTQEPAAWTITGSDAATPAALQAAGDIGVLLFTSSSWTGTLPTMAVDNLVSAADFGLPVNVPPTAAFTSSSQTLTASFDATTSSDAESGSITSYIWDFGDSTSGSSATNQHLYPAPGTYSVSLTVTDNGGATNTVMHPVTVTNNLPTASFTSSHVDLGATLTSTSTDSDGTVVNTSWDFGDGTPAGSGTVASHTYALAGTYTVGITVTDNNGGVSTSTAPVTVTDPPPNVPPTASFTYTSSNLTASLTSTSGDSDGSIVSTAWDFGDGTFGSGSSTQHTYAATGTYNVTISTTDDDGAVTSTTSPVTVTNILPNATFTSSVSHLAVTVTSTSSDPDGTIAGTSWDFGDGSPVATGASANHIYAVGGTYTVTITVVDDDGGIGTVSNPVTVTDPPTAYATDLFGRTVANGLGSADQGGAWTLSGAATSFAVGSGSAKITGAVNGNRSAYLAAVRQTDIDINTDVSLNTPATGGGVYVSVIGRRVSNNNDYRLKLRYLAGGAVAAYLTRTVGGTETIPASVTIPGLNVSPGDVLRTRFQVSGISPTTLRAKVWRQGNPEPSTWLLNASDTTPAVLQAAGDLGVLVFTSSSWTGAAPVISVDNFIAAANLGATTNLPPTAAFSSGTNVLTASLDGTASGDADGTIASYLWDFGDSTTGTGVTNSHTYASGGTYTVTLTVTDSDGSKTTVSHPVTVTAPPPNVLPTAEFTSSHVDLAATLTSTSSDPDGTIANASWNFGDSTPPVTGTPANHTYAVAGTYSVTLTVTDNQGGVTSINHPVTVTDPPANVAPTAGFTASTSYLTATVTSTSTDSDGTIANTSWNFGDSTPAVSGASAVHTYAAAGTYTVTITVTDDDGAPSTATNPVTVTTNALPTAAFTSSVSFLTADFTSTSTDSDGTIAGSSWNFGDGTPAGSGATPQHVYAVAGTYTVTLTVTDNAGGVGTITHPVTVTTPPIEYGRDLFGRVVANGLGPADLGGAWTISGTAADFSVNNGAARIAGAVSANRAAYLAGVRQTDLNVITDVALDRASTGGGVYVSVIGRRVSSGNDYRLKLRYVADGSVIAYLTRTVGGVETILTTTTVPGLTVSPGDLLSLRLEVSGTPTTTVRAKVWRSATAEPATWLTTNTAATPAVLQAAGDVGVLLYTSGSWVGTPAAMTVDNLHIGNVLAG